MRRESQKHVNGIVRAYRILPPSLNPRIVNSLTSPLTSGLSTKMPLKQNKSHGEVWSSQVHWVRSNDIASSRYKLMTWRVVTESESGSGSDLDLPGKVDDCEDIGGEAEVERMEKEDSEINGEKEDGGFDDDYDGSMSFYDVGMIMMNDHVLDDDDEEEEEEDGWCLV